MQRILNPLCIGSLFVSSNLIYRDHHVKDDGVRAVRKCLMKNAKTMYLLARAKATERGPRKFKRFVGYALTDAEVKRIFIEEGFNPKKKSMNSYLDMWQEVGWTKRLNLGEEGDGVYFFVLGSGTDDPSLIKKLELAYPDVTETADVGVMVV